MIKRIRVSARGDRAVGVEGASAVIVADGDFIVDGDEVDLEEVRAALSEAFAVMWGETSDQIVVSFDRELAAHEEV